TPTYVNSAININLKSNIGLYKFISNSNSNIEITYDNIALKNISLWVAPEESPVNWFTWDGTKITGLSELGKKENKLVLPSITTSLSTEPFILNKNITYIDLS
ncbi:MAG: hypothetical protein K2K73_01860, partial [Ureaplasma sp.]|nr:hypothetical protein [Ureaplasma sp.]